MALNIPFRNAYYRFASSYSFLFFISWSLWWSLYAIWLKGHLGLTGTELGTLYSVNQFTSILFMMFYGIVQDKLGLKKPLRRSASWCCATASPSPERVPVQVRKILMQKLVGRLPGRML